MEGRRVRTAAGPIFQRVRPATVSADATVCVEVGPATVCVEVGPATVCVEVGPATVRALRGGSGRRPAEALVSAGLDWIDDEIWLFYERPVAVADLWRALMSSILGEGGGPVLIVHPTWWPRARVEVVVRATPAREVRAVSRYGLVVADCRAGPVIEIAAEFVAVCGAAVQVFGRGDVELVADAAAEAGGFTEVFLDAAPGLAGSAQTAEDIRAALSDRGVAARDVDMAATVAALRTTSSRRASGLVTTLLVAVATVIALGGAVGTTRWRHGDVEAPAAASASLVEGRIAVEIPPDWLVERITSGPGSRRVEVTSPIDPDLVIHITSSYAPETTLAEAAEVLGKAVTDEDPGVFVGFRSAAEVAGRPAITYREIRAGRVIDWSVVLAGATLISIGCQSAPGGEAAVRGPCTQAVRTARELGTTAGP